MNTTAPNSASTVRASQAAPCAPPATSIPVTKGTAGAPAAGANGLPAIGDGATPFALWAPLRDEIDHAFNRLFRSFSSMPALWRSPEIEPLRHFDSAFGFAMPAVDMVEGASDYQITAELPGLSENDIEVGVANDILTLKGCKAEEREEKKGDYHLAERRYGTFQRSFHIPRDADQDKITARFAQGVLTLTLPKTGAAAGEARKIPISA